MIVEKRNEKSQLPSSFKPVLMIPICMRLSPNAMQVMSYSSGESSSSEVSSDSVPSSDAEASPDGVSLSDAEISSDGVSLSDAEISPDSVSSSGAEVFSDKPVRLIRRAAAVFGKSRSRFALSRSAALQLRA